jgi:hypothetical protein
LYERAFAAAFIAPIRASGARGDNVQSAIRQYRGLPFEPISRPPCRVIEARHGEYPPAIHIENRTRHWPCMPRQREDRTSCIRVRAAPNSPHSCRRTYPLDRCPSGRDIASLEGGREGFGWAVVEAPDDPMIPMSTGVVSLDLSLNRCFDLCDFLYRVGQVSPSGSRAASRGWRAGEGAIASVPNDDQHNAEGRPRHPVLRTVARIGQVLGIPFRLPTGPPRFDPNQITEDGVC